MNTIVKHESGALATQGGRMAVADIISHVATVQEVMRAVMKPDVHYGKIPGTDKPTLYKAGAEVLCMVFRIAASYSIEDISTPDVVRYRVTCSGTHQMSGAVLGAGMGEASSAEEKYKWRKCFSQQEFDGTPENMRRIKHGKSYATKQVRTEPADLANTILKMANKRANMAMVLNVTAASDCFAQDLEDMDEALRDHLTRHPDEAARRDAEHRQPLPPYPEDKFKAGLQKWKKSIDNGGVIADLFSMLESKYTLSDAQRKAINDLAVTDAEPKEPAASLADEPFVQDMQ